MFCVDSFFSCYVGSQVVNRASSAHAFDDSYYRPARSNQGYPTPSKKRKLSVVFKSFLKKMAEKRQQLVIAEVDALIP